MEKRKPVRAVPTRKPAKPKQPPRIQVIDQMRRYGDTPAFGFDVLNITVNGLQFCVYRACNLVQTPQGQGRWLPLEGGFLCFSDAEADAFQQQLKATASAPQLVLPGSPAFKKPKLLD